MALMTVVVVACWLCPNGSDGDCWSWVVSTGRLSAETMPAVTVPVRPSGEPTASTASPTRTADEAPRVAAGSPVLSTLMTARSSSWSVPTMRAAAVDPSLNTTDTVPPSAALATTWLLVRTYPSDRSTTPDPVSDPPLPRTLIDTTEGSTLAAMPAKDRGLLPEVDTGEPAIVKPPSADVLLSWSRATPTPTPAPPKTSAAKPAAAAGANHAGRRRTGWTGSEGDGSG